MSRDSTIFLLENLGFIINLEKSVLTPSQQMEYLGVIINSLNMTFKVPEEKVLKLKNLCTQMLKLKTFPVRKLASLIGNLMAIAPAFTLAPLQIRFLQKCMNTQLGKNKQRYESLMKLDTQAKQELKWWLENLSTSNGKEINIRPPDLIISSDAAKGEKGGWGASCGQISTGGLWQKSERGEHINILEMKAALLALKTFVRGNYIKSVHLLIDNQTALAHIVKLGRPTNPSLITLTKEMWSFLTQKGITLTAEYIPSVLNKEADFESRNATDWSDWKLKRQVFNQLARVWGTPEIDLFASRTSHQLKTYFSWRPDPNCLAIDALTQNWGRNLTYAFPPFSLIGRCLEKVKNSQATVTLIAPIWTTQPWYPVLLGMLTSNPRRIEMQRDTLTHPSGEVHPLILNQTLHLAAWKITGNRKLQISYQKLLPTLSNNPEQGELDDITCQPGKTLVAGVVEGKLIPFQPL